MPDADKVLLQWGLTDLIQGQPFFCKFIFIERQCFSGIINPPKARKTCFRKIAAPKANLQNVPANGRRTA